MFVADCLNIVITKWTTTLNIFFRLYQNTIPFVKYFILPNADRVACILACILAVTYLTAVISIGGK
jgi:hypothetical protein